MRVFKRAEKKAAVLKNAREKNFLIKNEHFWIFNFQKNFEIFFDVHQIELWVHLKHHTNASKRVFSFERCLKVFVCQEYMLYIHLSRLIKNHHENILHTKITYMHTKIF